MTRNINLRTTAQPVGLVFDEKTHKYTFHKKELISCTQLLAKHHLSPSYDGVDKDLLKARAEYGNLVHKEIENYIKTGEISNNSLELQALIKWLETSGYEIVDCEYLVCNDLVAGKVDLLLRHKETGIYVIADIKTTSTIHKESVSWQLSVYNYLDEDIAMLGLCLHFLKDGTLEVESIPLKAKSDIESLFEAEKNGEIFQYQLEGLYNSLTRVEELEKVIINYKALIKQAEEEEKTLHQAIRTEMESRYIKTMDLPNMKITITEDYEKRTFDKKAFEKAHPEIDLTQFDKVSPVKGTLKITLKGNKDETKVD